MFSHQLTTIQDVDQLFALIKAYLKGKASWEVPEEVSAYLREQLQPVVQSKGEVMHSAYVRGVRSYSSWLKPLQVAGASVLEKTSFLWLYSVATGLLKNKCLAT